MVIYFRGPSFSRGQVDKGVPYRDESQALLGSYPVGIQLLVESLQPIKAHLCTQILHRVIRPHCAPHMPIVMPTEMPHPRMPLYDNLGNAKPSPDPMGQANLRLVIHAEHPPQHDDVLRVGSKQKPTKFQCAMSVRD